MSNYYNKRPEPEYIDTSVTENWNNSVKKGKVNRDICISIALSHCRQEARVCCGKLRQVWETEIESLNNNPLFAAIAVCLSSLFLGLWDTTNRQCSRHFLTLYQS